ncbi:MAG TPA: hypothetical protein VMX76_02820 [Nevskiaceae bacterium]|nr:hypothetical protein [Nevskiaceae bacterium]
MATEYSSIIKHVLEIRLKKKNFSFLDFRGEMIDYLLSKTGFERIKISNNGARIDVVSSDLSEIFFFSIENFGLQIDGADDFKQFNEKVNQLFSLIEGFGKYKFSDVVRVGTKSSVFCHQKGKSLEAVKQKYTDLMLSGYKKIEKATGASLKDLAFTFMDFEEGLGKTHILTGPVTKDEVITKFFGMHQKYQDFSKKVGIFYDIDYYQEKEKQVELEDLKEQILNNVKTIEEKFDGFLKLFESKKDGK